MAWRRGLSRGAGGGSDRRRNAGACLLGERYQLLGELQYSGGIVGAKLFRHGDQRDLYLDRVLRHRLHRNHHPRPGVPQREAVTLEVAV